MGDKRKKREKEEIIDLDALSKYLLLQAKKRMTKERQILKDQIMKEAETVARWRKKPFYIT